MFPEGFLKRLQTQNYVDAGKLVRSLNDPSPVTIRINRAKWKSDPAGSDPVAWCRDAFYLVARPSFTLDPLFHAGCYYPQEASSMFLEEVFKQTTENRGNIRVLDLCGAPGGKSTHLSTMIRGNGILVSNEVIRSRAAVLAENLTKWGLPNSVVTQNDPAAFRNLAGYFDMILIDAPCSGEGMFRDPAVINEWSEDNAALCAERQKRILMDIWPALKEGGILIYSTCTFNPDENEKNIKWLLLNHKAESVRLDISEFNGIAEIDYEGITGYGFYPDRIKGEGLFISVLRKTESSIRSDRRVKPGKRSPAGFDEKRMVREWTDFPDESLMKTGEDLISVPGSYDDHFILAENLRIIKHGTKIFSVKSRDFIPSHDLALSIKIKNSVFSTLNINHEQALSFLRRESFGARETPSGWILVQYNGVNLGFIKNIGKRINNYYPVEWRIRMNLKKAFCYDQITWI